jgi:hypothetical protein
MIAPSFKLSTKPIARWRWRERAMQQLLNQTVQFVQDGITAIFRFVRLIWVWSVGQIGRVIEAPWQNWPLWKQLLLVVVAAAVVWALYKAAKELWESVERTLGAFAGMLGVLVKTLPSVLVAGLIALSGVWLINNLDLSSVHLPSALQLGSR